MGFRDFYLFSDDEKRSIFNQVAFGTGLPVFAVEKDWWVVRTLDVVFQTEIAEHTVFKGGTSLSKAWGIIDRFSEDVDLALDRSYLGFNEDTPSRKQITRLRKQSKAFLLEELIPQIKEHFEKAFLEVNVNPQLTSESDQDPLIIEINYPKVADYTDYVLPRILVEIGIRSLREPFTTRYISSMVSEQFYNRPFADEKVAISTVNVERTFLEKLFLLHEEFQRPKERRRVDRLSRHLYDIHQISKTPFIKTAMADATLYRNIVEHRAVFAKIGGVDYNSHYPPRLNPIPPDQVISKWEKDYSTMQEQMIYGESVPFKELISSLKALVEQINLLRFSD